MDLRDYMEILNKRGELHVIDKEVHWNLEAAALGAMNNRVEGPVILCRNIKGYPEGHSLIIDPFHGTFEKPYRRVALACGMDPEIPITEFTSELAKRVKTPIKPIIVSTGTCKENILLGKDVDLYKFPWPYIHYGDGGRYSTLQSWICKDPDSDWVNWANYRTMIHSRTAMGVNPTPGGHLYIIHGRNEKNNRPTPFCVTYGGDLACVMASAFAVPYGVSEVNIAGGLRQEPIELIKAETNDLYVPADAEIVVEGELLPNVRWDEGPFGEFAGFMHGPRVPRPVMRVNCVTFRNNPVLPVVVEGNQPNTTTALLNCIGMEVTELCRKRDLPVTSAFFPTESSVSAYIVNSNLPYPGIMNDACSIIETSKTAGWAMKILFDDVDTPCNCTDDVMEDVCLRMHPRRDFIMTNHPDGPAMTETVFFSMEEKEKMVAAHARCDITNKTGQLKVSFENAFGEEVKDFVKENWGKFGFEEPFKLRK